MTQPTIDSYSLANLDSNQERQKNRYRKLLIFQVNQLNLALPVESVKRIVHYTPIHGSGTTSVGLIHLDNQEITTIDLHKRLFKISQFQSQDKQFLIVAKNSLNELFGILVFQTPTLVDVPLSDIRTLPSSYRYADTLDMASHVMRVQQAEQNLTVFILDVDRLVPNAKTPDCAS